MLAEQNYRFSGSAREAFVKNIEARMQQPHFANARSIRNAGDRARLCHAVRLFEARDHQLTAEDLSTIETQEIFASRVMRQGGP